MIPKTFRLIIGATINNSLQNRVQKKNKIDIFKANVDPIRYYSHFQFPFICPHRI